MTTSTVQKTVNPRSNRKTDEIYYNSNSLFDVSGIRIDGSQTCSDAMKRAGLDYEVGFSGIYSDYSFDGVRYRNKIEGRKAVCRLDTGEPIGVVGNIYQLIQNRTAFSFFDTLVQDGKAEYSHAGVVNRGGRVWLTAKLPGTMEIAKDDVVDKYIVFINSHDGSSAMRVLVTPVRLACLNTLSYAMKTSSHDIVIRHSGDVVNKVALASEVLGKIFGNYKEFEHTAKLMADRKLTKEEVTRYFNLLTFGGDGTVEKDSTQLRNKRDKFLELFEGGKGNDLPGVRGSLWAGYNAVTEYMDHYRKFRGEDKDKTVRANVAVFGCGADFKRRAYTEAVRILRG